MHRMIGVAVRPCRSADLTALTDIYNHYVTNTPATFDTEPVTISARAEWLSQFANTGPHRLVVAEAEGVVVGYASSSQFRREAGVCDFDRDERVLQARLQRSWDRIPALRSAVRRCTR